MVAVKFIAVFLVLVSCQQFVDSQRSPYAGSRPTGYKDKFVSRPPPNANTIENNDISNRFGGIEGTQRPPASGVPVVEGIVNNGPFVARPTGTPPPAFGSITTSTRLPYDALGDAQAVHILQSRPQEQQPFWLLNFQAIEAHKNNPVMANSSPLASRSSFLGRK